MWTFRRRPRSIRPGATLRVQASEPFRLHWSSNDWGDAIDTASTPTALGVSFVDIAIASAQVAPIRFTFFWPQEQRWEGRDFVIAVESR